MKSKEYFNYLLYIGVILPEDEAQIKEIIQNNTKEKFINNDKNKFVQNLMGDYLASLNKESLIKLGINIYNQYHKNKLITIGKHLTKMTKILQKKFFHETKYYLNKLKKQFTNKENKNNIDKISRSQSSDKLNQYYNNINFNKFNIIIISILINIQFITIIIQNYKKNFWKEWINIIQKKKIIKNFKNC